MFGFIAGKVAATGRLAVDTPLAQIQSTAPAAGFGSLAFSIFTFSLIKELKAAPNDIALLDDGTIDYKDLKHGVYEIVTKEAHPRRIIVDDPGETLVLRLSGSGTISIEQVANTPVVMAQNEIAYQINHDYFLRAQQDPFIQHFSQEHANAQPTNNNANAGTTTASTGSTGSSTPDSVLLPTATAQLIQPVQNNTATPSTASVPTTAPVIISLNTTPTTPTELVIPPLAPTVAASNTLTVKEDGTVALGISETPANPSDTVSIAITGVPSDATLSAGTKNTDGSWTLTPAQLTGLNFTAGEVTPVTLTVTATTTNPEGTTASTSQNIPLTINPVAPTLTAPPTLAVKEDGTVALGISETPFNPNDTVSVTITGVPSDATLSAGTKNIDGSWTLTPAQLSGLNLTAGEVTPATLTVTATNTEGATASTSQNISLTVTPVAETPSVTLAVGSSTVNEGSAVTLTITGTAVDSDDTLTYTLTGIPSDATLSNTLNGTLTVTGGSVTLAQNQLAGLTLHTGESNASLSVTATDTEGTSTSAPSTAATADVTVTPVAETPSVTLAVGSSTVNEGSAVTLTITGTAVDSDDTLTYTLTGIPSDATLSNTLNGTLTVTGGSVTLAQNQLAGLTLHTGESNASLSVTATDTEGTSTSAPSTAATADVTVTPVAETPSVTLAVGSSTVNEGSAVTLTITGTAVDSDDTLTYTLTGIPSDATLSNTLNGTLTVTGGSVTLAQNQLAGLTLHTGESNASLSVTATDTEGTSTSAPSTAATADVTVTPVAETPSVTLAVGSSTVNEGSAVTLTITGTAVDSDDTLTYTLTGIPSDATLSNTLNGALTVTGGSVTLAQNQLAGLTLHTGESNASLSVTATDTEGTSTSAPSTAATADATVTLGAPTLTAPTTLTVNEDGTVALGISETPFNPNDTVSVTITGVPSDATLSAGTKNIDGSWTLTPAQLSGLNLTAGEVTPATLTVTANRGRRFRRARIYR